MNLSGLAGLRALVVGAAREGTALTQFLAQHGARVTLSDNKPAGQLSRALEALGDLPVTLALGGALVDLGQQDVLFLSPGVPPSAPIVQEARRRGLPMSSEPRLFTQLCPAPIVGITGSSGKTTTTTLVGLMVAAAGLRTWVGGNIGQPLIARLAAQDLSQPLALDIAVMELSSFQLELFSKDYQGPDVDALRSPASRIVSVEGWSPHVAAITNITPNHLDRHATMEDYARAKWQILASQGAGDWAVLNRDDARTRAMGERAAARVLWFSLRERVAEGAYLAEGQLRVCSGGREQQLCDRGELALRGMHNVANVLAAASCAMACGVPVEAQRRVATSFRGVEHRLETVRVRRGVTFVNDSIATSPERAVAALRAYHEPLILLAGGRDKHLGWEEWADLAWRRTRAIIVFGEAQPVIRRALEGALARAGATGPLVQYVGTMEEAVEAAEQLARAGDVVLLSPGGTSFDAYVDFEARGAHFRALVQGLQA